MNLRRNCLICGKVFLPKPSQVKSGNGKYCSLKCVGLAKRTSDFEKNQRKAAKIVSCSDCGVPCSIRNGTRCRRCITVKAGITSRQKHPLTGTQNPLWKGGITNTPEAKRRYHRNSLAKNPQKHAARQAARIAIRNGTLVRSACADCGSTEEIQAHHEDYSKPLDVTWLCRTCHLKRHGKLLNKPRKVRVLAS